MNKIDELKTLIENSSKIVVFTGAGVSTLSGIKDFRSSDGLYNMKFDYPAEYLLSSDCFYKKTEVFYEFYKKYMNCLEYEPNIIHRFIKDLEDKNKLLCVVTQNIDGLHSKAGSKFVNEIHGTTYKNHCIDCFREYDASYVFNSEGIPKCSCGGIIKPDVVLYGEMLPEDTLNNSIKSISECDLLIVIGTSLTVYPASSLVDYYDGDNLVILNKDKTKYDNKAKIVINDYFDNIFKELFTEDNYEE